MTIARTAASYGAHVRTRARVLAADGTGVRLRDELTGAETEVAARMVVNAAGVWAGDLADVRLRPSRGSHLVLRGESLPGLRVCVTAPVPGSTSRFVMALPQPDGTVYVGLTDEPVDGPVPDVPEPSEAEVDFLLDVVSATLARPLTRDDVVGAFAGLRPLLDTGDGRDRRPVPQPRRAHLARRRRDGRGRQADDVPADGRRTPSTPPCGRPPSTPGRAAPAGCRCSAPPTGRPWPGWSPDPAPRLVRRFGTDADLVLRTAREATGLDDAELLAPAAPHVPVTLAELVFGVTHEGAADVDDLLDRRTRVGLVPADRALVEPLARRALLSTALAG